MHGETLKNEIFLFVQNSYLSRCQQNLTQTLLSWTQQNSIIWIKGFCKKCSLKLSSNPVLTTAGHESLTELNWTDLFSEAKSKLHSTQVHRFFVDNTIWADVPRTAGQQASWRCGTRGFQLLWVWLASAHAHSERHSRRHALWTVCYDLQLWWW